MRTWVLSLTLIAALGAGCAPSSEEENMRQKQLSEYRYNLKNNRAKEKLAEYQANWEKRLDECQTLLGLAYDLTRERNDLNMEMILDKTPWCKGYSISLDNDIDTLKRYLESIKKVQEAKK